MSPPARHSTDRRPVHVGVLQQMGPVVIERPVDGSEAVERIWVCFTHRAYAKTRGLLAPAPR